MKISVLTVLYNQGIDSAGCLRAALASDEVGEVVACDNSTVPNDNAARARELGVTYVDMGGNRGLPAAYNAGVSRCHGDVACIFDDDTAVGEEYFRCVRTLCDADTGWDIALPLVMAGEEVLSPCEFDGYRAKAFASPEDITESDRLSGINSGMAVRRSVYEKVHYDEALFLDLVDHRFVAQAREAGFSVVYLDGPVLRQDFSLDTDSAESAARRLSIFEHDARAFYAGGGAMRRLYCLAMLLHRKAKLSRKYGSTRFFREPAFVPEGGNE